jgi:hypothetical protein
MAFLQATGNFENMLLVLHIPEFRYSHQLVKIMNISKHVSLVCYLKKNLFKEKEIEP